MNAIGALVFVAVVGGMTLMSVIKDKIEKKQVDPPAIEQVQPADGDTAE